MILRQPHGTLNPHGFDLELWLFEQGIRLNPTDAGQTSSAFVLFNADQSQAELTLPSGEQHLLTRIEREMPKKKAVQATLSNYAAQ